MIKKVLLNVVGCIAGLCLTVGSVYAQKYKSSRSNDIKFYAGVGAGVTQTKCASLPNVDLVIISVSVKEDCKDSQFAWKTFAGIELTKYFSAEVAFYDFNTAENEIKLFDINNVEVISAKTTSDYIGFASFLQGTLPLIENNFSLIGKVGFLYARGELEVSNSLGQSEKETESSFVPALALGLEYTGIPKFRIRGVAEYFHDLKTIDSKEAMLVYGLEAAYFIN